MVFCADGHAWEAAEMTVVETGNPFTRRLYIATDDSAVFVESVDSVGVRSLHRACADEIAALAARLGIAELRRAIPVTPIDGPADSTHAEARSASSD